MANVNPEVIVLSSGEEDDDVVEVLDDDVVEVLDDDVVEVPDDDVMEVMNDDAGAAAAANDGGFEAVMAIDLVRREILSYAQPGGGLALLGSSKRLRETTALEVQRDWTLGASSEAAPPAVCNILASHCSAEYVPDSPNLEHPLSEGLSVHTPTTASLFDGIDKGEVLPQTVDVEGVPQPVPLQNIFPGSGDGVRVGYYWEEVEGGKRRATAFSTGPVVWKTVLSDAIPPSTLLQDRDPVKAAFCWGDFFLVYVTKVGVTRKGERMAKFNFVRLSQRDGSVLKERRFSAHPLTLFHPHATKGSILLGERCQHTEWPAYVTVYSHNLVRRREKLPIGIPVFEGEDVYDEDTCQAATVDFFRHFAVVLTNRKREDGDKLVEVMAYDIRHFPQGETYKPIKRFQVKDSRFVARIRDLPGAYVLEQPMVEPGEMEVDGEDEDEGPEFSETMLRVINYPRNVTFLWEFLQKNQQAKEIEICHPPHLDGFST